MRCIAFNSAIYKDNKKDFYLNSDKDTVCLVLENATNIEDSVLKDFYYNSISSLENRILKAKNISLKNIKYKFYKDRLTLGYLYDSSAFRPLLKKEYDTYINENKEYLAYLALKLNIKDEIRALDGVNPSFYKYAQSLNINDTFYAIKSAILNNDLAFIQCLFTLKKEIFNLKNKAYLEFLISYAICYGTKDIVSYILDYISYQYVKREIYKDVKSFMQKANKKDKSLTKDSILDTQNLLISMHAYNYIGQFIGHVIVKELTKDKDLLKKINKNSKLNLAQNALNKRYLHILNNILALYKKDLFIFDKLSCESVLKLSHIGLIECFLKESSAFKNALLDLITNKKESDSYLVLIFALITNKDMRDFILNFIDTNNIKLIAHPVFINLLKNIEDNSIAKDILERAVLTKSTMQYLAKSIYQDKSTNKNIYNVLICALTLKLITNKEERELLFEHALHTNDNILKALLLDLNKDVDAKNNLSL